MLRTDRYNSAMLRALGLMIIVSLGAPARATTYDAAVARLTRDAYKQLGVASACRGEIGDMAFWQARAAVVTALRATGASAAQAFDEVDALAAKMEIVMPEGYVSDATRCILDYAGARKALARSLEEVRSHQSR